MRIFLNIARTGVAPPGELLDIAAADVDAGAAGDGAASRVDRRRQGRLSQSVAGDHDLEALRRARQVAGPLPVMLHVGQTFSPLPKILELLKPGDIVTHLYSPPPHGILDDAGRVLPEVARGAPARHPVRRRQRPHRAHHLGRGGEGDARRLLARHDLVGHDRRRPHLPRVRPADRACRSS